mgnify:FL=1|jgi:hypothetical protein
MYTIYYIMNVNDHYSFNSIQISEDDLYCWDNGPQDHVPFGTEYAGHYRTGSLDSTLSRIDLEAYCDRMNEPSYYDTRWSN